jgi:hypothetical protein
MSTFKDLIHLKSTSRWTQGGLVGGVLHLVSAKATQSTLDCQKKGKNTVNECMWADQRTLGPPTVLPVELMHNVFVDEIKVVAFMLHMISQQVRTSSLSKGTTVGPAYSLPKPTAEFATGGHAKGA